jgi:hypothetical protein
MGEGYNSVEAATINTNGQGERDPAEFGLFARLAGPRTMDPGLSPRIRSSRWPVTPKRLYLRLNALLI